MEDIIKEVKSLEDPGLLLKGVSETIKNEAKEQKGGFLSYNWCKFLLGNMLAGKGMNRVREEIELVMDLQDLESKKSFLIPLHPLNNFEIQKYYQSEPTFSKVYSRDNLLIK